MSSSPMKKSKFFAWTESVGELIILNFWTMLCCIPIFTIGAAISSMHDVLIRKCRNEFYSVTGSFFTAFKNNFRHATGTWMIFLGIFLFLYWDYELLNQAGDKIPEFIGIVLLVLAVVCFAAVQWAFVLVARYKLGIGETIGYAFTRIVAFPFRTIFMLVVTIAPTYLLIEYPITTPLVLLLGTALVGRVQSGIYDGALRVMEYVEGQQEESTDDSTDEM